MARFIIDIDDEEIKSMPIFDREGEVCLMQKCFAQIMLISEKNGMDFHINFKDVPEDRKRKFFRAVIDIFITIWKLWNKERMNGISPEKGK